ncbi:sodium:solute symporter [Reichenbachiella carrageenanivorans]|uniref:Sodium:solute symporter n=1 Tax=Reichenbachiella carrageenanivorans TaxID=2979869 RepID=A0ABY6CV80_9BACT|nr:Na+/H+ antiporter NhaC family protein [Reichenbachiella carrageenanivorans]UXX77826.1 sodium:solute symporter [Reichenbachiella carrageenanivorans]
MSEYGFWSLVPPLVAIGLALRTKQVFLSLTLGIWIGWVIINGGNPLSGSFATLNAFVAVFEDAGNTRTIIFTLLIGALIALIQRSGGVAGFIEVVKSKLEHQETKHQSNRRLVQIFASLTGIIIFVESNISILTVGTLYRPIFDNLKIPREKLAYLADSSSAPSCIIFPFNAWGAYIMGLLVMQGFDKPFATMMRALPYNFYPFLALSLVAYVIFTGKDYGPMKKAECRAKEEGKLIADGATPMISDEVSMLDAKANIAHRSINMILPITTMIVMMPLMLIYTGWSELDTNQGDFLNLALRAMGQGSGSTSVLTSVATAILVAMGIYKAQGLLGIKEMVDLSLKGMSGMVSLAILMVFAFALGSLCKELKTGLYVAEISKAWLSPNLVPAIVFLVSCFIAFSTGTSWGTFAIMISIAVPMAQSMGTDPHLAIAAAIGGGVFGDHCSPISDTTIISSMASASDHVDHVNTQLPYALTAGGATFVLYLILGFLI